MLGLMKFKKLFWKKSDEHDKLDELDHEFIAGFTKRIMWWILVIIIIAVVVMGSENEGNYKEDKYKEDEQKQWAKQIAPYARVKYAKITYVPHSPYGEKFTLVHQIDVKTDSIYGRW